MATGSAVFDNKNLDFKEAFMLLDSQETDVFESIKTLIAENLDSTKESWLINSLVDYFYTTKSSRVIGVLCSVIEPHDKFLLEKLHDGIKSKDEQLYALQLLLHVVCKQPSWINKVVQMPVLKVVIKCLKSETNVRVLMTGVTIVTILLPAVPTIIGPYLPDIFEIFNRLATLTIKKPVGNTPDIFLLHLQIAVYSLFHRLYGMYPYNFLTYLRHYYTKKENTVVFEEVIKNMLERVRLHPRLITGTKEQETSAQRWKKMETNDVIVECARMSLDPVEGTWEELRCPIVASRYMINRPLANQNKPLPPATSSFQTMGTVSPAIQSHENVFWSPSEMMGLSTPPPSQGNPPAISTLDTQNTSQHSQQSGGVFQFPHSIITPSNTPRETPPISEEHDKGTSRTSSRNLAALQRDPKRLSAEFTLPGTVPLLTPSSAIQSVPPSPLKTEFTSTPPVGVKTLPVLYAARELQFDSEHLQDDEIDVNPKVLKDNLKIMSASASRKSSERSVKDGSRTPSRSNSTNKVEDLLPSTENQPDTSETAVNDSVSVDNLSQVIDDLDANDDDSDEEVSALTADHMITAESVAKFMRSVNRIRFNSLSTTESIDIATRFGSKRSRSCPHLPKIEPTSEEDDVISRSVSTTFNNTGKTCKNPEENVHSDIAERKVPNIADDIGDISITSSGSTVTVNTKQETKITVETTTTSTINVNMCPMYANSATKNNGQNGSQDDDQFIDLFRQLLNPASMSMCRNCIKGGQSSTLPDTAGRPYFSSFSPPELLDQHIRLGGEIHAKELSKLPMPSTQNVNWTHFGGAPPADEISILRGQLMMLHNQLLYERNKREQHAKRHRRLLRKIANTKILEGQNQAMENQIKQHEMMIRDLNVSLKLLQDDNRKLKGAQDSQQYEKLVQLRSCLQENELLKTTKQDQSELLEKQKEDQEILRKKLMTSEACLFTAEKELETMRSHATMNVKLKDQIFQLQKEVTLTGELLQKNLNNRVSKHPKLEYEKLQRALKAELQDVKSQLAVKSKQLDCCLAQIDDKNQSLEIKEITLSELKLSLEKVKSSHNAELKCVEDKHQAVLRINQTLESQILQLNTELEELQSKLHSKEKSFNQSKTESVETSSGSTKTNVDPAQGVGTSHQKSPLRRMGSSTSDQFENSQTILAHLHDNTDYHMHGTEVKDSGAAENFESSDRQVESTEQHNLQSETTSSRDLSVYPGHGMLYTDSEDNRSMSAKSSNLGDSGFE